MASSGIEGETQQAPPRRVFSRTTTATPASAAGRIRKPIMDIDVVPLSLAEIAPFLRVANEVEPTNPRVAFLCRFRAFEKAHCCDPTSKGHGVRQFKTVLLLKLEVEEGPTLKRRVEQSDAQELQTFYEYYLKKYIQSLQNSDTGTNRAQLTRACQTGSVLLDVLKAISLTRSSRAQPELVECAICLENFGDGKEIMILQACGHGFHTACIEVWLHSHSSCPYCRQIAVMPASSKHSVGAASSARFRWRQWFRLLAVRGGRLRRAE